MSPLMRALETAAGAFGAGAFKGEGRPLMLSQTEDLDERAPHAAVACPEGIPFIAFEGCRERLGDRLCHHSSCHHSRHGKGAGNGAIAAVAAHACAHCTKCQGMSPHQASS